MIDVFYFGEKPNSHPREQHAEDLAHARSLATTEHFWIINEHCDYRNFDWDFDFDMLPDEDVWSKDFNNVWPSQYDKDSGTWLCPKEPAELFVYRSEVDPINFKNQSWKILTPIDLTKFDLTWTPDPYEPPYIYTWGNKYVPATVEPTVEYHAENATERKYMGDNVVVFPQWSRWQNNLNQESFDYAWRPNPHSPPQIYQWENGGPCYVVEGATDVVLMEYTSDNIISEVKQYTIKSTLEDLINEHIDEVFWALNPDLSYDKFDFDWKPDSENFRHINTFGNEYSKNTQTYFVNGPMYKLGHKEFNYVEVKIQVESNLTMFYIDRGLGRDRFDSLKLRYPQLQRTRYLNSWVETIQRCCNKSDTKLFWVLNSELDYSEFNFDFYPSPWQMNMVHVFGTQWSHWGNTYLVNKETFEESTKYVKVIEHLNILNFVKSKRAKAVEKLYPTVVIDHGNSHTMTGDYAVKYDTSYLTTFKQMLNMLPDVREQYVWIVSSICDYRNFDFTYMCDPYAKEQLHVFPSNKEKFGDTFLVNVNKFRTLISEMNKLEDYDKINFNNHQTTTRIPCPVILVEDDTHCSAIQTDFDFPYAIFQTENTHNAGTRDINLWEPETKSILVTTTGASSIVVPKEVKDFVKKELYDYPYIKVQDKLLHSKPLDIVFFSNGESCADENYEHLLFLTAGLSNRVVRVDGVQGRVASQHAAANSSNTPWYFLVNAKLKVNQRFDFDWQPDRLQIPKHYIFKASNPVNGLEYGHMAMVANNKKLTLNTNPVGLDFTMDSEHEVVDINSGVAMYTSSVWDTWRTAFRETLKLKYYNEHNHDLEAKFRLSSWLSLGDGEYGEYSTMGALDACRYYETVNGEFDQLRKSYDWAWLREHFDRLHPN